ncbi:MAG: hypothetical protein QM635_03795 [Microbacteriaceae bacterium]
MILPLPVRLALGGLTAGALAVGGVAAPASATDSTVAGYITPSTTAVSVPAYSSAPITVSSNIYDPSYGGYLDTVIVANGASYVRSYDVDLGTTGTGTVDLIQSISYAAFDYGDVPAGSYQVYFQSDGDYHYQNDYADKVTVTGAQSAVVTVTVTKLHTTISGWKTTSKSAKYGHYIKLASPTLKNAGLGAKVVLQYRKKGSKTWRTSESTTLSTVGSATSYKLKLSKFNTIKHKVAKRGTYYLRLIVKGNDYISGAHTKEVKVTWK